MGTEGIQLLRANFKDMRISGNAIPDTAIKIPCSLEGGIDN
jgi:hypothetical protein